MTRSIIGWILHPRDRASLLDRFPPAYGNTLGHHVTLSSGTSRELPLPAERAGKVVGLADDGRGVEALVVEIGGTTERGDGGYYHITWSLAHGRAARESNDAIREHGWTSLEPVAVDLVPGRWEA